MDSDCACSVISAGPCTAFTNPKKKESDDLFHSVGFTFLIIDFRGDPSIPTRDPSVCRLQ